MPDPWTNEEDIPWAARHARVSYRFEYAVLRLCQVMTQKAASELLHMSASTLSDQLHRSIERYRHGHRVRGVRVIGIDEVSYHKRHKYATLVYDLERSVVVWVGQGRGRATIDQFFDHQRFPACFIFNGLAPSKMAMHPCIAYQPAEKLRFSAGW